MTSAPPASSPPIYPAYCFRASPTYNSWVKLTAADVHALRDEPGFEGQNLAFALNHPIRFVRLVGPIVAIHDVSPRATLLTLDDSSGAAIDIKIARPAPASAPRGACASPTAVANLSIASRAGVFDVLVDDTPLDVGTVVKAKCTLSAFRGARQLELQRISVVRGTADEVRAWAELAAFRRAVLRRPWVLSAEEVARLKAEVRREERRRGERRRAGAEREARRAERRRVYAEKVRVYEEGVERRRRKEEVMFDAGALDRVGRGAGW